MPFAWMEGQSRVQSRLPCAASAIDLQDEEFGHEPAWVAAGEWAFVDDEGETCDFVAGIDEMGEAPETIEEVLFEAAV